MTMNAIRRQEIYIYKPIFFKVVLVSLDEDSGWQRLIEML